MTSVCTRITIKVPLSIGIRRYCYGVRLIRLVCWLFGFSYGFELEAPAANRVGDA